ncbi:MAG: PHB depolymerase family esterase [Alphaproteobacteria bacterium]
MIRFQYFLRGVFFLGLAASALLSVPAQAEDDRPGLFRRIIEQRAKAEAGEHKQVPGGSNEGLYVYGKGKARTETLNGRNFIVYTPPRLPRGRKVPLLVVLHGGFGQAKQIRNYIGLEPYADQGGFVVAYLDGTPVAKRLAEQMKGWNAGGCCGQPYKTGVDDVAHIGAVISFLAHHDNVDPARVYGTGHSNGAMMSMRLMCETDLYVSAVTISGTLQMDVPTCPNAKGKRILNIHGAADENLPIAGGHTSAGYNKETDYKSQDYSRRLFEGSGGRYDLLLLEGAAHKPETINAKLIEGHEVTLPQKIVEELGLVKKGK